MNTIAPNIFPNLTDEEVKQKINEINFQNELYDLLVKYDFKKLHIKTTHGRINCPIYTYEIKLGELK